MPSISTPRQTAQEIRYVANVLELSTFKRSTPQGSPISPGHQRGHKCNMVRHFTRGLRGVPEFDLQSKCNRPCNSISHVSRDLWNFAQSFHDLSGIASMSSRAECRRCLKNLGYSPSTRSCFSIQTSRSMPKAYSPCRISIIQQGPNTEQCVGSRPGWM